VARDVSERKRVDEILVENEIKFRTVADFTYDWEYWIAPDGHIIYCSPSCERITGYSSEELFNEPDLLLKMIHPEDKAVLSEHFGKEMRAGPREIDFRIVTRKGEIHWISHACLAVFDDRKRYLGRRVGNRDITERKRTEDALKEANRKLNLLSSITRNDIKNQLMILEGSLTLLEMKHFKHAFDEHLRKAEAAAKRISTMIRFTKEYQDIGVNAPIWQDVQALVDQCTKEVHLGQIKVVNGVPAGTEVFADPLIVNVFHNLVHNAVRHGGKITIIHFFIEEVDGARAIICEDDGIGISADMKEKLFTRGAGKGHGLGLFLSREILSITGITIAEVGEPGRGARSIMSPSWSVSLNTGALSPTLSIFDISITE